MIHISKNPLSGKIFNALRDKIVFMEYPPGMSLSDKELCKMFGVSSTPIKEAIRKLEEMKLVTVIPRYGTYVTTLDINEIRCAFEVKIKLEGLAGSVAARRITADKLEELRSLVERADELIKKGGQRKLIEIDTKFHEILYRSTQNPILQEILENIHCRCARLWNSALTDSVPITKVLEQLKGIYESLKKRDSSAASALLENHVLYFIDLIKSQLL